MARAQMVDLNTGEVHDLTGTATVGRAEDNDIVVAERQVSRHQCLIKKGLLGGWSLVQLGKRTATGSTSFATIRHGGEMTTVLPGDKRKLSPGDTIAFGKPRGDATIIFSLEFRLS